MAKRDSSVLIAALGIAAKTLISAFVIATPILGAWVSSSLAAYGNRSTTLAASVAVLLFPALPLVWEGAAWLRRARKKDPKPRILSLWDRVILRTLAINLVFLAGLLATRPERAFVAVTTRGDWMLDGSHSATSEWARQRIFWAATKLEWLYKSAHENPFRVARSEARAEPPPRTDAVPVPTPNSRARVRPRRWPQNATVHPLIATIPHEAEASIADLARYTLANEQDAFQRVKALHDWVATHVAYDAASFARLVRSGDWNFPPQDANSVFQRRTAVCAGYSHLFAELGKAAGIDIRYLTGDARVPAAGPAGSSHAWNAVLIEGQWYLVDVTWDAGFVNGEAFQRSYVTDYLFTPGDVFNIDHFPDDKGWQLAAHPIERGDFLRRPRLRPSFFALGLELLSPTRSQVTTRGRATLDVRVPRGITLIAEVRGTSNAEQSVCDASTGAVSHIQCSLVEQGSYNVVLFAGPQDAGSYPGVGEIEFLCQR